MCTVVWRWIPAADVFLRMMAIRDEMRDRAFAPPAAWWPDLPDVVGGLDRRSGGTWLAWDTSAGSVAAVVNARSSGPRGRVSRGQLPLLALQHGHDWTKHLDVAGCPGFFLLLTDRRATTSWRWDGDDLTSQAQGSGTHMLTSYGVDAVDDPRQQLFGGRFAAGHPAKDPDDFDSWGYWAESLRSPAPEADRTSLFVRRQVGNGSFESVYAQFLSIGVTAVRTWFNLSPLHAGAWESSHYPRVPESD